MRFPALDKALPNDDLRESLSYVYVDKDNVFASDAHIMVIHKTAELFDDNFIKELGNKRITLHAEIIKAIRSRSCFMVELDIKKGEIIVLPKFNESKKPHLHFKMLGNDYCNPPDYNIVLKKAMEGKETVEMAFNPSLFSDIKEAMGVSISSGLAIKLNGDSNGVYCIPNGTSEFPSAQGVIMPVMLNAKFK